MPRNFSQDITNLIREAEALKISHIKTATAITTKTVEIPVQIELDSVSPFGTVYSSSNKKVIAETLTSSRAMACSLTLNNDGTTVIGHDLKLRTVNIIRLQGGDYNEWLVAVTSLNPDDLSIVVGGGTVTLNYTMAITGTSNFTARVENA